MNVRGYVATAAALFAFGLGIPATASAEPVVPAGTYLLRYADGETATWNFTPCGPDCTVANAEDGAFVVDWRFQLTDGRWTYSGPNELACPAGGTAPIAMVFGFDAATLAGQGQATLATDTCGHPVGKTMVRQFQLTRTG